MEVACQPHERFLRSAVDRLCAAAAYGSLGSFIRGAATQSTTVSPTQATQCVESSESAVLFRPELLAQIFAHVPPEDLCCNVPRVSRQCRDVVAHSTTVWARHLDATLIALALPTASASQQPPSSPTAGPTSPHPPPTPTSLLATPTQPAPGLQGIALHSLWLAVHGRNFLRNPCFTRALNWANPLDRSRRPWDIRTNGESPVQWENPPQDVVLLQPATPSTPPDAGRQHELVSDDPASHPGSHLASGASTAAVPSTAASGGAVSAGGSSTAVSVSRVGAGVAGAAVGVAAAAVAAAMSAAVAVSSLAGPAGPAPVPGVAPGQATGLGTHCYPLAPLAYPLGGARLIKQVGRLLLPERPGCLATGKDWAELVQVVDLGEELVQRGLTPGQAAAVLDSGVALGLSIQVATHAAHAAHFAVGMILDAGQQGPIPSMQAWVEGKPGGFRFHSGRCTLQPTGGWRRFAYLLPNAPRSFRRAVLLLRGREAAGVMDGPCGVKFASAQLTLLSASGAAAWGSNDTSPHWRQETPQTLRP